MEKNKPIIIHVLADKAVLNSVEGVLVAYGEDTKELYFILSQMENSIEYFKC